MGRRRCPIAFFESPVAPWGAKSELPVVGNPTTEMGLCRTDTGQVIDTEGVTPKSGHKWPWLGMSAFDP